MQDFSGFLNLFFDNQYFIIIIAILILVLVVILMYLFKTQNPKMNSSEENKLKLKENLHNKKNEENISEELPELKALDISNNVFVQNEEIYNIDEHLNPMKAYEDNEEENAVISTQELEAIEKERDEVFGRENNIKLIEEYEEEQEKKAIISYDELLKNASSLELNYIEKPKTEDDAPVIKQIEVKEQALAGVSYVAEEEYLKLLKDFHEKLITNG